MGHKRHRRFWLIVTPALLLSCSTAETDPRDLVRRAIEAHGGEQRIAESLTGTVVANTAIATDPEMNVVWEEAFELPRRYRRSIAGTIQGEPFELAYAVTAGSGWIRKGRGPAEDYEGRPISLERSWNAMLALMPQMLSEDAKLSLAGTDKLDGNEIAGVAVALGNEAGAVMYFDRKTGLLAKSRRVIQDPLSGRETEGEVVFSDYRDIGGLKYPHRITSYIGTKKILEMQISRIEFVQALDDEHFQKPVPAGRNLHDPAEQLTPFMAGKNAGDEWDGNGIKMTFCWCPTGSFLMGSPKNEPGRHEDEDQVPVNLTGFYLAKYEVTQAQWSAITGTTLADQQASVRESKSYGEGPTYPMYYVSYGDAVEFCRRLTQVERAAGRLPEGWEYRLPSEAQWEYGCRSSTTTATAFGDTLSSRQANFDGSRPYQADIGPNLKKASEVGSYPPNAWGLCDVHGNVWEWCRDGYQEKRSGGSDPEGPARGSMRVFRGGGAYNSGDECRSACRASYLPTFRSHILGFRVAIVEKQ